MSTIDSAFLFAGALTAATYFNRDTADEAEIRQIAVGEGAIQSLAFSPDGTRLAMATGGFLAKPAITIWDVRTGERLVVCLFQKPRTGIAPDLSVRAATLGLN